jgi:predicted DNA-binding transcriptional regulator AlpA
MMNDHADSYLTGPMVNKRYNISAMTRWRWERSRELGFPAPLKINNRNYWLLEALQLWEGERSAMTMRRVK